MINIKFKLQGGGGTNEPEVWPIFQTFHFLALKKKIIERRPYQHYKANKPGMILAFCRESRHKGL